jgi:hypothetical protein
MKEAAFNVPDRESVDVLLTERQNETTLKPDSPVICINRGRNVLEVTYNAEHLRIPGTRVVNGVVKPGYFVTEYHAAQHFQNRCVVPGTRNLEQGGHVSWIGILGSQDGRVKVDSDELCEPFTDDELALFGEKIEAIDRSALTGAAADVVPVRTSVARAMVRGQGVSGPRAQIDASQQASELAAEAAGHVFDPVVGSDASVAQVEAANDHDASAAPAPRPMRKRR